MNARFRAWLRCELPLLAPDIAQVFVVLTLAAAVVAAWVS